MLFCLLSVFSSTQCLGVLMTFFWAFGYRRRAFRYIFARQTGVGIWGWDLGTGSGNGIWERDQELGMESNLVPVPETRSRPRNSFPSPKLVPVPKTRSRPRNSFPSPKLVPDLLAKDAAPIPNAEGWKWCFFTIDFCDSHKAMPYVIYVSPFQGSILYFLQKKVNILWFSPKKVLL